MTWLHLQPGRDLDIISRIALIQFSYEKTDRPDHSESLINLLRLRRGSATSSFQIVVHSLLKVLLEKRKQEERKMLYARFLLN